MPFQFYSLTVDSIEQITNACVAVSFNIPKELKDIFSYTQGQYITIKKTINNQEIRRSYSLCSSPLESNFTIAIKRVSGGIFSTYANKDLKVGDSLEVMPPKGKFFTPIHAAQQKKYVAFAAGSGITPIISIIKTTLLTEPYSQFILVYGNSNRNTIIFREALENLKNKFTKRLSIIHVLSKENTDSLIHFGRINQEKCSQLFDKLVPLNADEYFICGPMEMTFSVKQFLEEKAVATNKIHYELFTGAKQKLATKVASSETIETISHVEIVIDGRTTKFSIPYNNNILDAALQHGADLPFACKGGVCCTCKAKLISGNVTMENNYALEAEEVDNGFILTCQAKPTTENVVISFDEK
ncbi:MAG: 1,2-phenylacetyl-CoA epoxidase subunit PaaE [Chitinophagaceae bacterium]|jgi:ring-1,2-phenylacetyl-CoA epoxidase subunit PaaE